MIKRNIFILILTSVFILSCTPYALSQELTADKIIQKSNLAFYYAGDDGRSSVKMTITDSQGRVREKEFKMLRLNIQAGGEQKFYTYFEKPADVAKMVYMVWKYKGKDDDRWLYLPALDLVRRIAASDKRTSFVGSHYLYEDISGRDVDEDNHELIETTDDAYKLKNTPKDSKSVEFAYYYLWVDKNTFLPEKTEYYDENDELMRIIEAVEEKDIQGFPTITKSKATDFTRGGNTILEFPSVEYNLGLTDNIFTERFLKKPPVQWIK